MIRTAAGMLSALFCSAMALAAPQEPRPTTAPATVRVHGRVSTWEGQPLAGAAVRFEPLAAHTTAELLRAPQTTTGADGRFELALTPPEADARERSMLFVAAKGMASACLDVPWKRKDPTAAEAVPEEGQEIVVDDADEEVPMPTEAAAKIEYAPETEMPDIVLTPGQRLVGRVRDPGGKPLAGVRIVARDLLEQGNSFRSGRRFGYCCVTTSDTSGIFDLPCCLPFGSTLQLSLDGWFRERVEPVATGSPIEVTLRPGGWIQGRVLDAEGHSIADASVTIGYELAGGTSGAAAALRTGADGSFRTNLDRPGRWRATATKRDKQRALLGHSAVLSGPRENLEIVVKGDAIEQEQQRLPVRATDKKTGKPVASFRAASVWEEYANQNGNYLEYRLRWQMREQKPQKHDDATVPGPGKHGTSVGVVRVLAPGYAPATRKQIEWKEPEAGQKVEPVTLELEPEATLRGVVRDETTGAAVAGARVWARLHQDPNQGSYDDNAGIPNDAATTGADGTFRLTGLGEGHWDVLVRDPKRPRCPPKEVDLGAAEQKADFVVTVPSGAAVAGTLRGTPIARGAKVFLSKLPRQTFGEQSYYYSYYGNNQTAGESVDVAENGSFRFEGVSFDNHLLVLRLPSPPRHGGDLYLPLEPFRVRAAGVQREFDCSEDRPGTIRGKIGFAQAVVPFEQLVVVARLVSEEGQRFFSPFDTNFFGPRCFVGPTGDFEVRVGPGSYQLVVVDLATSLQLHDESKKIEVPAGGSVTRDLQLQLARIDLELAPAAEVKEMAAVDRIEIRVISKAMKDSGVQFGGNDNYDSGIGLRWPQGATKLGVVLPLGEATFLCRNGVGSLRIDDERWNNAPLGRAELEVATGQGAKTSCTIEVGGPPEIPDPEKKKEKEGEEDGAADKTGKVDAVEAKK